MISTTQQQPQQPKQKKPFRGITNDAPIINHACLPLPLPFHRLFSNCLWRSINKRSLEDLHSPRSQDTRTRWFSQGVAWVVLAFQGCQSRGTIQATYGIHFIFSLLYKLQYTKCVILRTSINNILHNQTKDKYYGKKNQIQLLNAQCTYRLTILFQVVALQLKKSTNNVHIISCRLQIHNNSNWLHSPW